MIDILDAAAWTAARPWLAAPAVTAVVTAAAGHRWLLAWRHRRHTTGARWISIAVPPEVEAGAAAAFWVALTGILTPATWRRRMYGIPHVAWEYVWSGRTLTIRLWVPGTVPPGAAEAAITGAWPGSTVTTTDAGPPVPAGTAEDGGALWPQHPGPLRTRHDADPLRALLAAGGQVRVGEHACMQILARPASAASLRRARRAAAGATDPVARVTGGLLEAAVAPATWLIDAFLPGPSARTGRLAGPAPLRRDPVAAAAQRQLTEQAVAVPHWQIAVRYAVATTRTDDPGTARDRLAGLAHSLAGSTATYTGPGRLRRQRMRRPAATLTGRIMRAGWLAASDEVAALAALPQDLAVPGLDRARAKAMPAPAGIPSGGRSVKVLGRTQIGAHAVGLNAVDTRQHVHLVGKTGVGKSTLLLNMILADVHARRGVVLIDPRGDLVEEILDRLPASYADRIAIIDPDQDNPACFNPLDDTGDPHLAVDNLVGVFSKIFQRHWGPRIDDTLRVACLTLMRHAHPTLSLVPPLLNDRTFRARFVEGLSDPEGLGGYWDWYDSMNDGLRAQVIGPVLARLRAFLLRDFVKQVIGTPHTSFQMADILDGGLLLCRLPKGILGEDTARILGSLIVARVWQAAIARAGQAEDSRRDATLYIDECQNFLNLPGSVEDMLAEARGFRLGLVLAHQNLAQLPKETAEAISANARSKIMFNIDPDDARQMAKHTKPELSDHDLAHLDAYTGAARLLVGNREMPAFTFKTNPRPDPVGEATAIRQAVAAAHARPGTEPAMQQLARHAMRRRGNNSV